MTRLPIIIFILLIALGFSGWLALRVYFEHSPSSLDFTQPNAIIENVIATRYDEKGRVQSKLDAPQVQHFEKNNIAIVNQPHLVIYHEDEEPWTITADHAKTFHGVDTIELYGNVKIHQPLGKQNSEINIKTNYLIFFPSKAIAETDKPISFQMRTKDNAKVLVTSVGARMAQKTGIVELFSKTRGYYVPAN